MAYQHAVADHNNKKRYTELAIGKIGRREVFGLVLKDLAVDEMPGRLTSLSPIHPFVLSGLASPTFGHDIPPLLSSLASRFARFGPVTSKNLQRCKRSAPNRAEWCQAWHEGEMAAAVCASQIGRKRR